MSALHQGNGEDAPVRARLVLRIEEASGKSKTGPMTWDTTASMGLPFEAFVKVELRGASRSLKAQTRKQPLIGDTVIWQEDVPLDVLEGSKELRLMLCREKISNQKKGTAVIAACGIFVDDILEAMPIDKYFELFKPNMGGEGGYIRICLNYAKDAKSQGAPTATGVPQSAGAQGDRKAANGKKQGSVISRVLRTVVTVGLISFAAVSVADRIRRKKKQAK